VGESKKVRIWETQSSPLHNYLSWPCTADVRSARYGVPHGRWFTRFMRGRTLFMHSASRAAQFEGLSVIVEPSEAGTSRCCLLANGQT